MEQGQHTNLAVYSVRFAAVAGIAAGQVILITFVIGRIYRPTALDSVLNRAAGLICARSRWQRRRVRVAGYKEFHNEPDSRCSGVKLPIPSRRDDAASGRQARSTLQGRTASTGRGRLVMAAAMAPPARPRPEHDQYNGTAQPAPAAPPVAPQPVAQAALDDSHVQLAAKFVEAAEEILHNGIPGEHQWQQGRRPDWRPPAPSIQKSPATPRLLAETWAPGWGHPGHRPEQVPCCGNVGQVARGPVVQVELIDRYSSRMQTAEPHQVPPRPAGHAVAAPEVKAHAAVLCVLLLAQRSNAAIRN